MNLSVKVHHPFCKKVSYTRFVSQYQLLQKYQLMVVLGNINILSIYGCDKYQFMVVNIILWLYQQKN